MVQEENPWLIATNTEVTNLKLKAAAAKKSKSTSTVKKVDINAAASMLVDVPVNTRDKSATETTDKSPKSSDTGLASLSQAELVKRAFASPDDLEAEKEFQEEKVRCWFHSTKFEQLALR
jgi:hypothetical protein